MTNEEYEYLYQQWIDSIIAEEMYIQFLEETETEEW